jgi:uncharacterized membrane protein YvbJ
MSPPIVPCPHCGAEIPADAKFCRHCGSSDSDGWRDEDPHDAHDDDFDYEEYVQREFPDTVANTQTPPLWRLVAVVLLIVLVGGYLLLLL